MTQTMQPRSEFIADIVEGFREIAEINGALPDWQDRRVNCGSETELLRDELAESIGEKLMNRRIEIVELPSARELEHRPITKFSEGLSWQDEEWSDRTHPRTGKGYAINGHPIRYSRRARGRVDAIDAQFASIVTRPLMPARLVPFGRIWSQIVDADGELLVSLRFPGEDFARSTAAN